MGPPRNPSSGDKLDIILSIQKISRDFSIQKISRDITAKYEEKQELKLKSSTFHTDILYYTFDVQLFLMHPKSFKSYSRRAV